jgi:hypothetical protein
MDEELVRELKHLRELMEAQAEMDRQLHEAERRALLLASADIARQLAEGNRFREQLELERGLYVSRELHDKLEKDMNSELDKIRDKHDERLKILEGSKSNLEGRIWMLGVFFAVVQVVIRIWWK